MTDGFLLKNGDSSTLDSVLSKIKTIEIPGVKDNSNHRKHKFGKTRIWSRPKKGISTYEFFDSDKFDLSKNDLLYMFSSGLSEHTSGNAVRLYEFLDDQINEVFISQNGELKGWPKIKPFLQKLQTFFYKKLIPIDVSSSFLDKKLTYVKTVVDVLPFNPNITITTEKLCDSIGKPICVFAKVKPFDITKISAYADENQKYIDSAIISLVEQLDFINIGSQVYKGIIPHIARQTLKKVHD